MRGYSIAIHPRTRTEGDESIVDIRYVDICQKQEDRPYHHAGARCCRHGKRDDRVFFTHSLASE